MRAGIKLELAHCSTPDLHSLSSTQATLIACAASLTLKVTGVPRVAIERVLDVLHQGSDVGLEKMLAERGFPPRSSLTEGISFCSANGDTMPAGKIKNGPPYIGGVVHLSVFGPIRTSKSVVGQVKDSAKSLYDLTHGELAPTEHFRWKKLGKYGQADFSGFGLGCPDNSKAVTDWAESITTAFGERWPELFEAENRTIRPVDRESTFFVLYNWGGTLKRKTDQAVRKFISTATGTTIQVFAPLLSPQNVCDE